MKKIRGLVTAGLSLGLVAMQSGCAQTAAVTKPADKPEAIAKATPPPAEIAQTVSLSGKIVESVKAGGYTYVSLEKEGKVSWAAMSAPLTAGVGEQLSLKPGMVMKNFASKALNRSFDSIVFTDGPISEAPVKSHNSMPGEQATPKAEGNLTGKVVETMDAGGYTYLSLEKDGNTTWVALPLTKVSVGQQVEVMPGMPMQKFTSKTLNRTFDRINFSSGLVGNGSAPAPAAAQGSLPPGHPTLDAKPSAKPEQEKAAPAPSSQPAAKKGGMMGMMAQSGKEMVAASGKVVETLDSGGYTYVQLEQGGKTTWAAVPGMKVAVGQELKLQPGTEMINFTSKSLNKTFDRVIFSPGVAAAM